MKQILCFVILLTMCASCNKIELFPSYIQRFLIDPTEIKAHINNSGDFYISASFDKECSYASDGENKWLYNNLCKEFHDTSYYLIEDIHYRNVSTIIPKPSLINITSSDDFDDEHLAGSTLNDVIQINYTELQQFINTEYNPEHLSVKHIALSGFDYAGELVQYGTDSFEFIKEPSIKRRHELTISITFGDKKTLSTKLKYDFDKYTK